MGPIGVYAYAGVRVFVLLQTFVYNNNLYFQLNPFTTPVQVTDNRGEQYLYNGIADWLYEGWSRFHFRQFVLRWLHLIASFIL